MIKHDTEFNDVTVIIPEHKRPEHLRRLLDYFLCYGIKVIVADSSDQQFEHLHLFEKDISYRFLPKNQLAEKLFKILPLIETPFVFMCANDDFIVPETVNRIIQFLRNNPSYNSGQGIFTDFTPVNDQILSSIRYKDTQNIDLNDDSPVERLFALQRNYFQYYYCVFRTDTFKQVISSVVQGNIPCIKNLCLLESYMSSYSAIDGKHIIIPTFYAARENIQGSAAANTDTIPVIIRDPKYKNEYKNYISLLSSFLASKTGMEPKEAEVAVIQSVKIYVEKMIPGFFSPKGIIKFRVKELIKQLDIFHLRNIYNKRYEEKGAAQFPDSLDGKEYWGKIREYILKYNYIYKKQ